MTELEKMDALKVATLFAGVFVKNLEDLYEGDRSRFLKACSNYWEHSKDLKKVAWFLGQGVAYISSSKEDLAECLAALSGKSIPQWARDDVKLQFACLKDQAIQDKKRVLKQCTTKRNKRQTNIYLILNKRNGFVKIGASRDPVFREATLQSEEPELQLLKSWPGLYQDEEDLHNIYSQYRVRGEWFALTNVHIAEIITLADKGKGV